MDSRLFKPFVRRAAFALLAAATAAIAFAPAAEAAYVDVSGPTLRFVAGVGEANRTTMQFTGATATIVDPGATFNAGPGCIAGVGTATCGLVGVAGVAADLADGADIFALHAELPGAIAGGPGEDILTGGSAGDTLVGGPGNDVLGDGPGTDVVDGGEGDDQFNADTGADRMAGGPGFDTANYTARTGPVTVVLDGTPFDGAAGEGDDVGGDVERVLGGAGDDRLVGNPAGNDLRGGGGNDQLDGGLGADGLSGGPGRDTANFSTRGGAVAVSLDNQPGDGEGGEGDNVAADVEDVLGGAGNDALVGSAAANDLRGGDGDDALDGGAGGDALSGGGGTDIADYSARGGSVTVDFDGRDDGETDERDDVHGDVENVTGGSGDDRLMGDERANGLRGGDGNDGIDGGPGEDALVGGDGADLIVGGPDVDELEGGPGNDKIDALDRRAEVIRCGTGRDGAKSDVADTIKGCELWIDPAFPGFGPEWPNVGDIIGVQAIIGGGRFVRIPGYRRHRIDRRLLKDIAYLRRRYRIWITAGYEQAGHTPRGEHPRGLALDIVPAPGASWRDIDRLAKFAEPRQGKPRPPWRWVGYNGDYNHGRGNHLHLSWQHSPVPRFKPARRVHVFRLRKANESEE